MALSAGADQRRQVGTRAVIDFLAETPPGASEDVDMPGAPLRPGQLQLVLENINVPPGEYTLPELLGTAWQLVRRKT